MTWFISLAILLRLVSVAISIRNERRLKAGGAVEYGAANSMVLALAHVLFYILAAIEGLWRAAPLDAISYVGFILCGFGMAMLFVVIHLLGRRWTVKLILAPDHELVAHSLFRRVRHPNDYLNILPELVGFALVLHAFGTLLVGLPLYLLILAMRIRQEDHLMKERFAQY